MSKKTPPRVHDLPELCTVEETGAVLRASKTWVYQAIKEETLRSVRLGRLIRIPRSALEELLETNRQETKTNRELKIV